MYEVTKKERETLISKHKYSSEAIDFFDAEINKVRKGIPINGLSVSIAVSQYQTDLQKIRKSQKKWWQFWK